MFARRTRKRANAAYAPVTLQMDRWMFIYVTKRVTVSKGVVLYFREV